MQKYAPPRTLQGSTTPRIWTKPLVSGPPGPCGCGCALTPKTSLGFSAVDFAEEVLGIVPLPWQRWLLIHGLELLPTGRFRFRTLLVMVARQNGKTLSLILKNLWKMYVLGVRLVIGTAQDLDTAEEAWDAAIEIAESMPELADEIKHIDKTNGKKAMKLNSGSRWKIVSTSRRGGRGKSGDDVNLDELREHLNWDAWGAVTKTTMARPKAQIWAFSNAGDDRSVVLNSLQAQGRAGLLLADDAENADLSFGMFEWSADEDVKCTCPRIQPEPHHGYCRLRDKAQWAKANPSLGITITEEALESALNTDPEQVFRTECLCQRVPNLVPAKIPATIWAGLADLESSASGRVAFGVDVNPERTASAISGAGKRADGLGHLELIEYGAGTGWVVKRAVQLRDKWDPVAFVLDPSGPAGSLIPEFEEAGICVKPEPGQTRLMLLGAREMAQACGAFYDGAVDPQSHNRFKHRFQPELNAAVEGAVTRPCGDAWAWDRRNTAVDICPLVSATAAKHGFAIYGDDGDPLDNIW